MLQNVPAALIIRRELFYTCGAPKVDNAKRCGIATNCNNLETHPRFLIYSVGAHFMHDITAHLAAISSFLTQLREVGFVIQPMIVQ